MSRRSCSPEDFVRAWQTAANIEAAARQLGLSESSARSRAALYRRRGIPLKKYRASAHPFDAPALAELARSLVPTTPPAKKARR